MSTLVVVVGIPLYRLIINKCSRYIKKVQMLTKMWMGLYLSLVQVVFYIIVVINHDSKYWLEHSSVACIFIKCNNIIRYSPALACLIIPINHWCDNSLKQQMLFNWTWTPPSGPTPFLLLMVCPHPSGTPGLTMFEYLCPVLALPGAANWSGQHMRTGTLRAFSGSEVHFSFFKSIPWSSFEGISTCSDPAVVSLVLFYVNHLPTFKSSP